MSLFSKSSESKQRVPDASDCLAAVTKFGETKVGAHAFYQKYRPSVDTMLDFVKTVSAKDRKLGWILASTGTSVEQLAQALRKRLSEIELVDESEEDIRSGAQRFQPEMVRMLEDTSRPKYLDECRWVVEAVSAA